ncbi:ferrous iron transport protein B, partial [Candidatus Bathyarchaeota archaeon]|nr:ferrous iron transport protein B [Candidatus Bathyarchaeota archaeon]
MDKRLDIALAGNANVGKSVIFNQLTGLHQHVGNWPGKTVERAEGTLSFGGYTIDVIDLPGIYSLSTFSIEELVSREYIAVDRPDVIINVVDACVLERNLFFTLQLLELESRMVIDLNQVDLAGSKGIQVDTEKLSKLLGVPVVPTVATKNIGLHELMEKVVEVAEGEGRPSVDIRYGQEVENRIKELTEAVSRVDTPYPSRWIAIKLLEGDDEVEKMIYAVQPSIEDQVDKLKAEIEEVHGHNASSVITHERYIVAHRIADEASTYMIPEKRLSDHLYHVTSHPVLGYIFMAAVILTVFYTIFNFGDYTSGIIGGWFEALKTAYEAMFGLGSLSTFIWDGLVEGIVAGVTIALPYIVPFYVALSVLEDSGYLTRIAFLMDSAMHKIGFHGKGFIPMMLGFGCNVPACLGCRIMGTDRERLLCAFAASMVPCAARSVVIMGLVAEYVGLEWAIALYIIDFVLIFILGRIAFKVVPGEPMGLIMEMPPYRWPTLRVTASKTWFKLRDFVYTAFPIIVIGNLLIQLADLVGLLDLVQGLLSPITVLWLGLPMATGVILIFGILRKELTLILLASLMGTSNFALVLTPVQM